MIGNGVTGLEIPLGRELRNGRIYKATLPVGLVAGPISVKGNASQVNPS